MDDATILMIEGLAAWVKAIFEGAGLASAQAEAVAWVITAAERDGCKPHGVYRIEGCLRTLQAGKVVPDAEPALSQDASAIVRWTPGPALPPWPSNEGVCPWLNEPARWGSRSWSSTTARASRPSGRRSRR